MSERQIGRRQFVKKTVGSVVQIGAFSAIAQRQASLAQEAGKADLSIIPLGEWTPGGDAITAFVLH